jgi:hypothetical protein
METQADLAREQVLSALVEKFASLPEIIALWEAGSAAFNRVDQWSDIDLMVVVQDESVQQVFSAAETVLEQLSPISLVYEVPQPSWHGHHQKFYRLAQAGEYMLVDLAVMKLSSSNRFLEEELHGKAQVFFDRQGIVQPPDLDWKELRQKLEERLEQLPLTFEMFQSLVKKEILRQHPIDAQAFYQSFTIRPLVELLRIKYTPARYQFSLRYLCYDLPEDDFRRLEELVYTRDLQDLEQKHAKAVDWFRQILQSLQQTGLTLPDASSE